MTITVTPAATGTQLVRASMPMPAGTLMPGQALIVAAGEVEARADVRILTTHPADGSARRALVTFPHAFADDSPVEFTIRALSPLGEMVAPSRPAEITIQDGVLRVEHESGMAITARVTAPRATTRARREVVESSRMFLWERYHIEDPEWPQVVEVRVDRLGTVALVAHLQRVEEGFGYCPDLGWRLGVSGGGDDLRVYHPTAELRGKQPEERTEETGQFTYEHLAWSEADKAPMQQASWRRAEVVIGPASLAPLTPTLQYPHDVRAAPEVWAELYGDRASTDLTEHPQLAELVDYHHRAIVRSVAHGKDWGNVTGYADSNRTGYTSGMNRLNHCPPIFEEGWRTGDRRLVEVGVAWCDNMYDQSLWWGPDATGGTRYNNIKAMGQEWPFDDASYMWRSNSAVHFCTKGYDTFLLAYEQTGDPRMREALEAQVAYASEHVFVNRGEARNVGDVRDFIRLYDYTGEQRYLDEALRMFRELREVLSEGDLFSQGGQPIEKDGPFIDDDQHGYGHPFAKPYIIGYALAGLPELAKHAPDEPKLREVIQAVADFLAESMDPLGGWRYPHPASSHMIASQGIEHAWQIVQADRFLGAQEHHLDAVEAVLRQRIHVWVRTGKCFSGLGGWEIATGKVESRAELYDLYERPADRDPTRDYSEGDVSNGGSSPEGLVYFPEVLAFYLEHRTAEELMREPAPDEPLGIILARLAESK